MRKITYWTCFTVVATFYGFKIASTAFYFAGRLIHPGPPLGSREFFGPIHVVSWPHSIIIVTLILFNIIMLLLISRRIWITTTNRVTTVPASFKGIAEIMAYVGTVSITLGFIVFILSIAAKAGSGIPAGLISLPAMICVPCSIFLTEVQDMFPKNKKPTRVS